MAPYQIIDPRRITPENVFCARLAYDTLRRTPEVVHAAKNGALRKSASIAPYQIIDPRRITPENVFCARLAYDTLRPTPTFFTLPRQDKITIRPLLLSHPLTVDTQSDRVSEH